MKRHDFYYFFHEGMTNLFSHGFMSFAAVGITVACLLIMGTFSLVAYNAEAQLKLLESENEIVAFVDDSLSREEGLELVGGIRAIDNVESVQFITREEALKTFASQYEGDYMLQDLDSGILRDRISVRVNDISLMGETADRIELVDGIAKVRMDEDVADGFMVLRNVAGIVCVALITILFIVSVFIISNTIKLTTFDRREEIAIMKMVGATNAFIRWPFVYEGFLMGVGSAVIGFLLQCLLYGAVSKSVDMSDTLQIIKIVDFSKIWHPVAMAYTAAGMSVGIGGSLTAIRKFLKV